MTGGILVVGSINMDVVTVADAVPAPGETFRGQAFHLIPGGKGANQAVAALRLGGRTALAGRVGADAFGHARLEALRTVGIDTSLVIQAEGESTGVAVIAVNRSGQNAITVVNGANDRWTEAEMAAAAAAVAGRETVLLQLEVPLPVVTAVTRAAKAAGVRVVLDPAPPVDLPAELLAELLAAVDLVIPNEHEASALTGVAVKSVSDAREAAARLRAAGARAVIVKLGGKGVFLDAGEVAEHIPGFAVEAVDTTAAGDTFAGALAVALSEGRPLRAAIRFAQAAAAISVTRLGAQPSIPGRREVDEWLTEREVNPVA